MFFNIFLVFYSLINIPRPHVCYILWQIILKIEEYFTASGNRQKASESFLPESFGEKWQNHPSRGRWVLSDGDSHQLPGLELSGKYQPKSAMVNVRRVIARWQMNKQYIVMSCHSRLSFTANFDSTFTLNLINFEVIQVLIICNLYSLQ